MSGYSSAVPVTSDRLLDPVRAKYVSHIIVMKTVNQFLAERRDYPLKVRILYVASALSHVCLGVMIFFFSVLQRGSPDVASFAYYTADLVSLPVFSSPGTDSSRSSKSDEKTSKEAEQKHIVVSEDQKEEKSKKEMDSSTDTRKDPRDSAEKSDSDKRRSESISNQGFTIAGGGNRRGDGHSLGSMDMRFAWYRASVVDILNTNWIQVSDSFSRQNRTVIVRFAISQDGTISGVEIEQSSGSSILDRGVRRAINASNPLPQIPSGIGKKQLTARFKFVY